MAPGQSRINFQVSKMEMLSFFDEFRAGYRFAVWDKNIRTDFLAQTRQVSDMIRMRMGKENQLHVQFVALGKSHHFAGIASGIEDRRNAAGLIPEEISVHCHL